MRPFAILLPMVLLAGCVATPPSTPPVLDSLPAGQGAVVIGFAVRNPTTHDGLLSGFRANPLTMRWIGYDPRDLSRTSAPSLDAVQPCSNFDRAAATCPTVYTAWTAPAGHYTLGWATTGFNEIIPFNVARFDSVGRQTASYSGFGSGYTTGYQFSGPVELRPNAPAFSVWAGEVVYVGNVVFDLHGGKLIEWTYDEDMATAQAFIAGGKLAPTMTLRPWERIDGAPGRPAATGR